MPHFTDPYKADKDVSLKRLERLIRQGDAFRENWQSILYIKEGLDEDDMGKAAEAWFELSNELRMAFYVAPKYGGLFTTKEREILSSTEFRQAYYGE